ncbi:hypothetical protein N7X57_12710 [Lactiplantibacillus paraplantarum]|uniref:hypothetical protein n=1 Tax=Lactiplantibacillus paraplantarum TaxID=60520 RepID=UPI000E095744|nr:hypothetical protein [Lactiplantibacillus paraplantarum]MCW1911284.1 hypothetical protein [Lactiplantibacillus paraplantarum]RDG11377.1 hypothetical protein DQM08_09085 [Lactiplantibacillus paraplantarum]
MKKILVTSLTILTIGLIVGLFTLHQPPTTAPSVRQTRVRHHVAPITMATVKDNDALRFSCIIYYAVKHLKIQRWQEVSDFQLGWQVEIYTENGQTKYLVWPDKHIQASAKQLQPNWFTFKNGQVTYDSFGVHTFQKDLTATVSLTTIVTQIKRDHATKLVRHMPTNLVIKDHR